mgnify:CR=1 FL=1
MTVTIQTIEEQISYGEQSVISADSVLKNSYLIVAFAATIRFYYQAAESGRKTRCVGLIFIIIFHFSGTFFGSYLVLSLKGKVPGAVSKI